MDERREDGRRLYKARGPDGQVAWVDHDELWRLQQEQAERVRQERARRRRLLLSTLAALVAVALLLVFFRLRMAGAPPTTEVVASAPAAAEAEPPAPSGPPAVEEPAAEAVPEPSDTVPAPSPSEQVASAVRSWAAAWERRDVAAYLSAYGDDFEPADGSSRSSWRALRRRRLTTPGWIRVEIEGLEIVRRGDGLAEARFLQSYTSPDYADVVRKTLELVEEEGQWRILAERAETP